MIAHTDCRHGFAATGARPQRAMVLTQSAVALVAAVGPVVGSVATAPLGHADNKRLNDGVVANVYTIQHQAGCTNDVRISPQLQLAAEWHARDMMDNRNLDGAIGSDGSSPQQRANAAGFDGPVAQTVAIHPAVAISSVELLNRWYHDPASFAVMSNCASSTIGVWSENSPDRTVVVAVYGHPPQEIGNSPEPGSQQRAENVPLDPSPEYDASDELEFGLTWLPWILRGVYPPPGYPAR